MALLDLLGRRWALRLLWELRDGDALTFRELQAHCGNVSSSVLNQRLRELRDARVITQRPGGYVLTSAGEKLISALAPMDAWANEWAGRLPTPADAPDKVEVARRAIDAYNRRDVDGLFAELATPDFEYYPGITRGLEGSSGYRGREGVDRFATDTSENWQELQAFPQEFRDLGDRVLVLGRLKGRGKGSGAPVDTPTVTVLDFRGDRIWRSSVYLDHAEGLRAAGLSA